MVEEIGSGSKLQKQNKGPWVLGERIVKVMHWGGVAGVGLGKERERERPGSTHQRERMLGPQF